MNLQHISKRRLTKFCRALSDKPLHNPTMTEAPKLHRFAPLTEKQVYKVINVMDIPQNVLIIRWPSFSEGT